MILSELPPDTILIQELEKATGNIVLTASLSLVRGTATADNTTELVQIAHELGENGALEGHQVWRLQLAAPAIIAQREDKDDENSVFEK